MNSSGLQVILRPLERWREVVRERVSFFLFSNGRKDEPQFRGEHRSGDPDPRVQLVQPHSQPILDVRVRDDDTTSQEQRNRNRGIEQHPDLRGWVPSQRTS